jgi:hypothetical protein
VTTPVSPWTSWWPTRSGSGRRTSGCSSRSYGVAAVDAAAARLVDRQRRDRTSVLGRFAKRLHRERRLAPGVGQRRALALLLVLTSFETYLELRRHAGLAEREVVRTLHAWAAAVLLARA